MNLLSTDNSFYRYHIAKTDELSESCFTRRQSKARQNGKRSFFFEISPAFTDIDLLRDFLTEKSDPQDVFCVHPGFPLDEIPSIQKNTVIFKVLNKDHLYQLPTDSDHKILMAPLLRTDLVAMTAFYNKHPNPKKIFWLFSPYNADIKSSLTVKDICSVPIDYQTIAGLEIFNTHIPAHYELEPQTRNSYKVEWQFRTPDFEPDISVIIPTFNNSSFLANVLWHLIKQNSPSSRYEIIVADDGSEDNSSAILKELLTAFKDRINLTYIYWSKKHPQRGPQNFFRPGLARNLACRYSRGKYLVFLDSDMLVPPDFIQICRDELSRSDIIQFQRFHIHQTLSRNNPQYSDIELQKDTYIEEKSYWSQLFFCNRWSDLPYHWKYTCTYALGIEKEKFVRMGMFKKYYISYGFEDTDLGYEAHKRNYSFSLVKTPLLHLTSYDQMQYKNSASRRLKLLRVTAELFFLQHLDRNVYNLLGNFYRSQKPLRALFRDLVS